MNNGVLYVKSQLTLVVCMDIMLTIYIYIIS